MYQKNKDKRSIQSRNWIYDALKDLMLEKPYESITITDIVNVANLGRSTFYRNFKAVDDVLKFKCDEDFEGFRTYCIEYYLANKEEDQTFLTPFLRYWCAHYEIIELLMKANKENILKDYLAQEIMFFIDASSISENPVISQHLDYFIDMRVSNSISILTQWIKSGKNLEPDALSKIISNQVTQSIKLNLLF